MMMTTMLSRAVPRSRVVLRGMATVGDQLPSVELHAGWPPQKHNLADFAANKKIILMGLPGACTYCSVAMMK